MCIHENIPEIVCKLIINFMVNIICVYNSQLMDYFILSLHHAITQLSFFLFPMKVRKKLQGNNFRIVLLNWLPVRSHFQPFYWWILD